MSGAVIVRSIAGVGTSSPLSGDRAESTAPRPKEPVTGSNHRVAVPDWGSGGSSESEDSDEGFYPIKGDSDDDGMTEVTALTMTTMATAMTNPNTAGSASAELEPPRQTQLKRRKSSDFLREQLVILVAQREHLKAEKARVEEKRRTEAERLKAEKAALRERLVAEKMEIEAEKEEAEAEKARLAAAVERKSRVGMKLVAERREIIAEKRKLEEDVEQLEAEKAEIEEKLVYEKEEIQEKLEADVEQLEVEKAEIEEKLVFEKSTIVAEKREIEAVKEKLEEDVEQLEAEKREIEEKLVQEKVEIQEKLQADVAQAEAEKERLAAKAAQLRSESADQRRKHELDRDYLKSRINELRREVEKSREEKATVDAILERRRSLSVESDNASTTNTSEEKLQSQVEALRRQVELAQMKAAEEAAAKLKAECAKREAERAKAQSDAKLRTAKTADVGSAMQSHRRSSSAITDEDFIKLGTGSVLSSPTRNQTGHGRNVSCHDFWWVDSSPMALERHEQSSKEGRMGEMHDGERAEMEQKIRELREEIKRAKKEKTDIAKEKNEAMVDKAMADARLESALTSAGSHSSVSSTPEEELQRQIEEQKAKIAALTMQVELERERKEEALEDKVEEVVEERVAEALEAAKEETIEQAVEEAVEQVLEERLEEVTSELRQEVEEAEYARYLMGKELSEVFGGITAGVVEGDDDSSMDSSSSEAEEDLAQREKMAQLEHEVRELRAQKATSDVIANRRKEALDATVETLEDYKAKEEKLEKKVSCLKEELDIACTEKQEADQQLEKILDEGGELSPAILEEHLSKVAAEDPERLQVVLENVELNVDGNRCTALNCLPVVPEEEHHTVVEDLKEGHKSVIDELQEKLEGAIVEEEHHTAVDELREELEAKVEERESKLTAMKNEADAAAHAKILAESELDHALESTTSESETSSSVEEKVSMLRKELYGSRVAGRKKERQLEKVHDEAEEILRKRLEALRREVEQAREAKLEADEKAKALQEEVELAIEAKIVAETEAELAIVDKVEAEKEVEALQENLETEQSETSSVWSDTHSQPRAVEALQKELGDLKAKKAAHDRKLSLDNQALQDKLETAMFAKTLAEKELDRTLEGSEASCSGSGDDSSSGNVSGVSALKKELYDSRLSSKVKEKKLESKVYWIQEEADQVEYELKSIVKVLEAKVEAVTEAKNDAEIEMETLQEEVEAVVEAKFEAEEKVETQQEDLNKDEANTYNNTSDLESKRRIILSMKEELDELRAFKNAQERKLEQDLQNTKAMKIAEERTPKAEIQELQERLETAELTKILAEQQFYRVLSGTLPLESSEGSTSQDTPINRWQSEGFGTEAGRRILPFKTEIQSDDTIPAKDLTIADYREGLKMINKRCDNLEQERAKERERYKREKEENERLRLEVEKLQKALSEKERYRLPSAVLEKGKRLCSRRR